VLAVIFFLSLDSILRVMLEHNIRAQTGMDAEIGKFHLDLFSPVITIKDFKLYNPPDFGGTLFLDIPEIHAEYDRAALLNKSELHVTFLRFNLGELDVVKNLAGQTNIFALSLSASAKKSGTNQATVNFKKQTGYDFKGIDVLNVSVGKVRLIDLKDPRNNREQTIGIENCVMKNVNSPEDLAGLGLLIGLRGGDFFTSLAGQKGSGLDIPKLFGQ
jgi:hypothetical protein